ncbi:MAG TPA: ChaN family lipoprotein [Dissulfurispiraceae bacterium]|nr:ChaN family lipoprotein [Dissulfurispiraceae bacterium]
MKYFALLITMIFFCSISFVSASDQPAATPEYLLSVSFDIAKSRLDGVATLPVRGKQNLFFDVSGLTVTDVTLDDTQIPFSKSGDHIEVTPAGSGLLKISYNGFFYTPSDSSHIVDNTISAHGIFLTGLWYPLPRRTTIYRLKAILPEGYDAVSEADRIDSVAQRGKKEFTFTFDHPAERLNFIATDRFRISRERFGEIDLYAYFFDEDAGLVREYLQHAKAYLDLYQKMLGPYPYLRFSIVENILPTGYSMPTFTLLGKDVVKLPFIVKTSLGHEILHQWFGNSVYIDYERGNWAEGLTTYLADYLYAEKKGEGADYRKQIMIDYQSYVNKDNAFPLTDFRGRTDFPSKAIGYGKAAMIFHMLKNMTGEQRFRQALRGFIAANAFRKASWEDLISSFQSFSAENLKGFFAQWLERKDVPDIEAGTAVVRQKGDGYEISFELRQMNNPYSLTVPIAVYSGVKKEPVSVGIEKAVSPMVIYSRYLPDRIVIDEDYAIMRKLSRDEFPPVIARVLGDRLIVVVPPPSGKVYDSIIQFFADRGATIEKSADIGEATKTKTSFVVLGADNKALRHLGIFDWTGAVKSGFMIDVMRNPFNPDRVIVAIDSKSQEEADAAFPKILHYGKFSRLAFTDGKNILKEIETSTRGVAVKSETEAAAVHVPDMMGLSQVIGSVADKHIIYVGENHDSYANHAVQLETIKRLQASGKSIAIGMEMFQRPFQPVIDRYIAGSIDQKTFLKQTEYFSRWGFDYDLYKPILDFARGYKIPVIALNIEKEVVDAVARKGIDSLPAELKAKVPGSMDFSNDEYRASLKKIFAEHPTMQEHGFDFFYQSQLLWDETMAETASDYLSKNPGRQMIVLAGNGHLAFGFGIPRRTNRRDNLSYAVILNDVQPEKGIADYVVFPKHIEGSQPVRLMVLLAEEKGQLRISGFPENSISRKAGLAEGDVIVAIDGIPVHDISDVKICLLDKKRGEQVSVKVSRGYGSAAKELQFEITL